MTEVSIFRADQRRQRVRPRVRPPHRRLPGLRAAARLPALPNHAARPASKTMVTAPPTLAKAQQKQLDEMLAKDALYPFTARRHAVHLAAQTAHDAGAARAAHLPAVRQLAAAGAAGRRPTGCCASGRPSTPRCRRCCCSTASIADCCLCASTPSPSSGGCPTTSWRSTCCSWCSVSSTSTTTTRRCPPCWCSARWPVPSCNRVSRCSGISRTSCTSRSTVSASCWCWRRCCRSARCCAWSWASRWRW